MDSTDHLPLPTGLTQWLNSVAPEQVIDDHRISINREWWTRQFHAFGFEDTLVSNAISRGDVFALGDAAVESPDGALTLLWNAIAWGAGRRPRNVKGRLAAVAEDRDRAGSLLQTAARLSRTDPRAAYETLRPGKYGNAISWLGPAFFTKFLYFAGAGAADHPCCILDDRVARSLRTAGWKDLRATGWTGSEYADYCTLVDAWRRTAGAQRIDLVERWLFDTAGAQYDSDENEFTDGDLASIYYWCWLATAHDPDSTSVIDFQAIAPKIERLLGGDVLGLTTDYGDHTSTEVQQNFQRVRRVTKWLASHRGDVVEVVRNSDTRDSARTALVDRFDIDSDTASLCLLMPIWRLTDEELDRM